MRTLLTAALLAAAAPTVARADPSLRLEIFDGGGARPASAAVEVPSLRLEGLAVDQGGGAGGARVEPVVCLILGIFPGFGLGHYLAGSSQWTTWLVIDIALLAAAIVVSVLDVPVLTALAWIAWIVEHVFQGIDAYQKAGGRLSAADAPAPESLALAPAPPGPGPESARPGAGAPQVVLARF